ncbi:MAG: 4-hydroxy-3-methylbut-2-enyl diphosphate reductase, partial [Bacteroidales bacterium]|nr:4-hydroxy-3-methylbut-2-enyl diphosphate reductase [Bacteroidales bacterium]
MKITIDPHSGFCFGVVRSINIAEEQLKEKKQLYCLGDIVHNNKEVDRLAGAGMIVVHALNKDELEGKPVLIRAHGEPPETYRTASDFHIPLIDATCPVVLKLQERIRDGYKKIKEMNGQLVIFGKKGHAEVIGLEGQTDYNAKVVSGIDDLDILDYSRPILLYSQTTQNPEMFKRIRDEIEKRLLESNDGVKPVLFEAHDTICRQ